MIFHTRNNSNHRYHNITFCIFRETLSIFQISVLHLYNNACYDKFLISRKRNVTNDKSIIQTNAQL